MSAGATSIGRRVVLKLEVSMAFEALILNRLAQLSPARREDWLRSLLVEGFKGECRTLKDIQRAAVAEGQWRRAHGVLTEAVLDRRPAPAANAPAAAKLATRSAELSSAATGKVTLAALRKMIG